MAELLVKDFPGGELHRFPVVLVAGSAGALSALLSILPALPANFPGAVIVTQHRPAEPPSILADILARRSLLPVRPAVEGERVTPGAIYVASPRAHLHVSRAGVFGYANNRRIRGVLASANPLFESVAEVFGPDVIAVVLSGGGMDATDGVQSVKRYGGTVIVQDRATSRVFGMAASAIQTGAVDAILPVDEIASEIVRVAGGQARSPA